MRRTTIIGACAAGLVGLGATPAIADDDGNYLEGRGDYEPAPAEYYDQSITFEACDGETFTTSSGDVNEAKFRFTEFEDGRTLDEYLGPETIDITRDDGVVLDELEVGGYGRTVITPQEDGSLIIRDVLFGESLIFPFFPEDSAALIEDFGTDLVYWEDPDDTVTSRFRIEDPENQESPPELLDTDVDIDGELIDLCAVFDQLAEDDDEDPKNEH